MYSTTKISLNIARYITRLTWDDSVHSARSSGFSNNDDTVNNRHDKDVDEKKIAVMCVGEVNSTMIWFNPTQKGKEEDKMKTHGPCDGPKRI